MNGDGRVNIADYALFRSEYGRSDCSSAAVYFYHTDHLGTPRKMTDSTGAVVWAADYQPFGRADLLVNTVENNLRFPGQYFDAETGLHYNLNRYYDPDTGRYLTPDPIGLAGGINLYGYAFQNPVNYTDPHGLFIPALVNPYTIGLLTGATVATSTYLQTHPNVVNDIWQGVKGWFANENTEEGGQCSLGKENNQRGNPPTGEPGEWVEHPHGKQDRLYGPDGTPKVDIDYGHNHGQGSPHAHNWNNGVRGPGAPVSVIK